MTSMRTTYNSLRAVAALLLGVLLWPAASQAQDLPLGSPMPSMQAQVVGGGSTTLAQQAGSNGTAVLFWSNQCPWVDKYESRVQQLSEQYSGQGIAFVLINANDPEAFPQEAASASQERASRYGSMTYLRDQGSAGAKMFGSQLRTPHVFVFDGSNSLVYVGAIDDSPGDPANVKDPYLKNALEALVAGQDVPTAQTKAFGCAAKLAN